MIILKILLWILLSILGIIILACIIPADVDFSYLDGKMKYKIKLWFFDLMDSSKNGFLDKRKKKKKQKKAERKPDDESYALPDDIDDDIGDAFDISDEFGDLAENEPDSSIDEPETAPAAESAAEDKKEKKEKKKKEKKKKKDEETVFDEDEDIDEDSGEEKPRTSKLEKLGGIWLAAKNPAAMIFKGFKFRNFYIDFIIADEDAYKCAVKYGRYSTLTYNGLSLFSRLFSIRFKTVDIQPGFGLNKGRWDTSFTVRFRLGTAVIAGIWFLITYIFRVLLPKKLKARKMKKTAAVQDQ